eukprot:808919_1
MAFFAEDTQQNYGDNEGQEGIGYNKKDNVKRVTQSDSNCTCVKQFLDKIKMSQYYNVFMDNECGTIEIMESLSKSDLKEMGIKIGPASLIYKSFNNGILQQFAVCRCNQKLIACHCCYGTGTVKKIFEEQFKKTCGKCGGKRKYTERGKCQHLSNGGQHYRYTGRGDVMAYSSHTQCPDCTNDGYTMLIKKCNICYGAGFTTTTQKNTKESKCPVCQGDGKIDEKDKVEQITKQLSNYDIDEKRNLFEKFGNDVIGKASIGGTLQLNKLYSGYKITAVSNFPTARANFYALGGKYYYEVQLNSAGLMQIGFADNRFNANESKGTGVGDDIHSWGFDGDRKLKWCNGSAAYGSKWSYGDTVGCFVDIDNCQIRFALNGVNLGLAFSNIKFYQNKVYPAFSLQQGESMTIVFDKDHMRFPPRSG